MPKYLSCLILALLLAACGGDSSSSPAAGNSTEAESTEAAATVASTAEGADAASKKKKKSKKIGPSVEVHEATGFSVNSSSIPTAAGTVIGGINAFCEPSDSEVIKLGANVSPHVNWGSAPEGTKSFALVVVDPDAPASAELVNTQDVTIPEDAERTDFYHWVVADIPATVKEIAVGASGRGVKAGGKPPGKKAWGLEGVNSYGDWFADDPKMKGSYGGYDGPCPPWNDERVHRYVFHLYALDVATLGLSGAFTGGEVIKAAKEHTLARSSFTGVYTLNGTLSL